MKIYLAPFMLFFSDVLKIFLDIASYDCLSEHLSSESMLRSSLSAAILLGNTRVVDCDEPQARELVVIARNHCPDAVRKINDAFFFHGRPNSIS